MSLFPVDTAGAVRATGEGEAVETRESSARMEAHRVIKASFSCLLGCLFVDSGMRLRAVADGKAEKGHELVERPLPVPWARRFTILKGQRDFRLNCFEAFSYRE